MIETLQKYCVNLLQTHENMGGHVLHNSILLDLDCPSGVVSRFTFEMGVIESDDAAKSALEFLKGVFEPKKN